MDTADITEQQFHEKGQYQQDFDLIEGGICFVLADGSERVVFANRKAALFYECEDAESFLQFCAGNYQNLIEEEDYKPLSLLSAGHPEHFPLSFQYRTRYGHFRKAVGAGTLRETTFGKTYVLLILSAEQITSDLVGKDKTGVLGMHEFFEEALRRAEDLQSFPEVRAFCPVILDLTSFKEYNRLYGMQRGDLCLKKIAETITVCFPGALVGHLTADHFAALLPSADLETKLESVCREVNSYIHDDGIQLKAGIYLPEEQDSLQTLRHGFDAAKIACDSIKKDGNRSIAFYSPSMGETIAKKNYVLRNFSEALEKHYIKVFFQPIIRTLNGDLSGFEALTRWEDPKYGMIFPDVFIPVLEDAQLINRLDRYVLEQVCRLIRDRMDNGLPLVPVSLNLSAYDFDVANPLDTIEKMVQHDQIPRTLLHFEITERVMFRNPVTMSKTVQQFQQAGYQVWMDDFGSEYSSLNLLHSYHFDVIKIDRGFFSHFDVRSRQIITSVVTMARMLGIQTLAEGVETKEQVSFLKKIGCGRIQGYYYGKPMRYDDTFSFMQRKGLQVETPEEAQLMNAAESVDVISDTPTALFSFDGTNVSLLLENDAYQRELRSTGTQGMSEANANLADAAYPVRGRFQQLMRNAFSSRAQETLIYTDHGQYMRVSVRWVAGDERYWIGEAHLYNISNNEAIHQAKTLDSTLRDIFQFGDRISVSREVLDSLPERVIVSDTKTYELVYLNKAARKDVGVGPESSLKGCSCYRVLEGFEEPCRDCPNLMLRMDRVLAASHMNHKTGENLVLRSFLTTRENRTLKITFAFNLNEYLNTLAGDREQFYQLVRENAAISRGIQEADPEKAIEKTMLSIAEDLHPERFLIFEEQDESSVSATYEWTAPGVVPLKEELQSIPRTELRALYTGFVSEHLVMVRDMKAFQQEHPDFSLRIHNVKRFISGQLLLQNQAEGFTLVVNPSEESFRSGSVMYSTLTDFIAVMVRNRNYIRELEKQSMIDQLTGAGNRRALEQWIQAWQGEGVLGVISIDLNGLKNTNDSEGHHAGDVLISETARILMECAGEDCVFRTGGDEFIVVTEDLEERDIRLLIQHMRESAELNGISMAIGFAWTRGKVSDFDALLTKADFAMYQNKGHSFRRRRED